MRRDAPLAIALLFCLATAAQVRGELIASGSYTGSELFSNSGVSFPTRTPVVQGTSLYYDAGKVDFEKLLVLNLLPRGVLSPLDPVSVHILANFTVQDSPSPSYRNDHDPGIGIGNGAFFGGFIAADNTGGEGGTVIYRDIDGAVGASAPVTTIFTGAGYPTAGQTLIFESTITLTSTATQIQGAFGSGSGSYSYPALDLNTPLSLVVFAHDSDERYMLDAISFEVQGTRVVPEPSTLVGFAGLGAMGLIAAWRKRRRGVH